MSSVRHIYLSALLAGAIALVMVEPAVAGPYVGIDVGIARARSSDVDPSVTPASGRPPAEYDDALSAHYRGGADVALLAGYDFGWFRLEAEGARKRMVMKPLSGDENVGPFINSVRGALDRPDVEVADLDPGGTVRIGSAMVNALVDVSLTDRTTLFGGGGIGRSRVSAYGDSEGAMAWQYIVGVRTRIRPSVELGFKHRYFNSGIVALRHEGVLLTGNPDDSASGVVVAPELEGELRTRSYQLSLTVDL